MRPHLGIFSPFLFRSGRKRQAPPGPCRLQLESASKRRGPIPLSTPSPQAVPQHRKVPSPRPGRLALFLCCLSLPLQQVPDVNPAALFPKGLQSLPSPPSSPPGPWCSSRGCTSPSSPVGSGRGGVLGPAWASWGSPLVPLHELLQDGVLPRKPPAGRGGGEPVCAYATGSCELMGAQVCLQEGVSACACTRVCMCVQVCLQVCTCAHISHKLATSRDAVTTFSSSDHHNTLRGEAGWDSTPILELR